MAEISQCMSTINTCTERVTKTEIKEADSQQELHETQTHNDNSVVGNVTMTTMVDAT